MARISDRAIWLVCFASASLGIARDQQALTDWRPAPPTDAQLDSLVSAGEGCLGIFDKQLCLSSKDGSSQQMLEAYSVKGEACVWCGGGRCTSNNNATCGPFDLLMSGEGRAFDSFY
ncbi:unnamed protein product, partial [Polarella glacialis]